MNNRLLFLDPKCLDSKETKILFISKMATYSNLNRDIILLTDNFKEDAIKVYNLGVRNFIIEGIPNSVESIKEYLEKHCEYQYFRNGEFKTLRWSDLDEFNSRTGYRYDHPFCSTDFKIVSDLSLPSWLDNRKLFGSSLY